MTEINKYGMISGESAYLPTAVIPEGSLCEQYDPWIEIRTAHLAWNASQVKAHVGDVPIMAVVKCNAYGHGTVGIAQTLEKQGIRHFAVVKVAEALALRAHGIEGTVLNFGPFSPAEAEQIVEHGITQSVFSNGVETLARAARKIGKPAKVHVKIDTGLSRVGVPYQEALAFLETIAALPDIRIDGIFTTLTEEDDFDPIQLERLNMVCDQAAQKGIRVGIRHAASTDSVVKRPAMHLDMVRPGNCFYGFEAQQSMRLKPVMSLKTRVSLIKSVDPGQTLSYHRPVRIEENLCLAVLPLGYADGFPFQAAKEGQVLIRGRRFPMIDCMTANHTMVDITGAGDIEVGDEVVVVGTQKDETISLKEVAAKAGSSVYKVATGMSPFLPRLYIE